MSSGVLYGRIVGGRDGVRRDNTVSINGRIARIRYREGAWMDSFGFDEIIKGAQFQHMPWGRNGGDGHIYPADEKDIIPDWAYINGISVQWNDKVVEFIKLHLWNRAAGKHMETLRMGKENAVRPDRKIEYYFDPNAGDKREICGFAACSDDYLNAIGIYVRQHDPSQF